MAGTDLVAILPLIVVAAAAVAVMLAIAARRSHGTSVLLTCAGLGAALAALPTAWSVTPRRVPPLLVVDGYGLFYIGMLLAGSLLVAILAYDYQNGQNSAEGRREEFYILLLLAALGACTLVVSGHFVSLFLGLEILSVALYALIAYHALRKQPIEAGLKYLVLGSVSAAFLLFGMALVYSELGVMDLASLAAALGPGVEQRNLVLLLGVGMMLTGAGFKLGVVPFHLWAPDVYEGAPAPVGAFIASISKASMVALVFRYFTDINSDSYRSLLLAFSVIAIASMFAGNLLALLQNNLKRILAYSSISHLGYVLVALQARAPLAAEAAAYYLAAYVVTLLAAFGTISVLSGGAGDTDRIEDYQGLFWRRPLAAVTLTAAMLSLAGIPLTAGFVGKFYVVAAGIDRSLWPLVIVLVLTSVIGLFYYLRVVVAMYSGAEDGSTPGLSAQNGPLPAGGMLVLSATTLLLLIMGVYPGPLMDFIRGVTGNLLQ